MVDIENSVSNACCFYSHRIAQEKKNMFFNIKPLYHIVSQYINQYPIVSQYIIQYIIPVNNNYSDHSAFAIWDHHHGTSAKKAFRVCGSHSSTAMRPTQFTISEKLPPKKTAENMGLTLWWTNKKLWKITIFNGKIHYKWPFSMAKC